MPKYDWLYSDKMPDGHRLFYTADPKKIAIVDDSGDNPEDTDDGVLWLDFTTPLGCKSGMSDDGYSKTLCRIPVISQRDMGIQRNIGTRTYTISDAPTIILLSSTYHWPINVQGILFKAERA
jgi:hypothetical protein